MMKRKSKQNEDPDFCAPPTSLAKPRAKTLAKPRSSSPPPKARASAKIEQDLETLRNFLPLPSHTLQSILSKSSYNVNSAFEYILMNMEELKAAHLEGKKVDKVIVIDDDDDGDDHGDDQQDNDEVIEM